MYNSAPLALKGSLRSNPHHVHWQGILAYLLFLDLSLFYFLVFDLGFHVCS